MQDPRCFHRGRYFLARATHLASIHYCFHMTDVGEGKGGGKREAINIEQMEQPMAVNSEDCRTFFLELTENCNQKDLAT